MDTSMETQNKNREIKSTILQTIGNGLETKILEEKANYFAEYELKPEDISVEVDKVGKLSFPLNQSHTESLISVSSVMTHRSCEEADEYYITNTISERNLTVSFNADILNRMMIKMGKELGFDESDLLTPQLLGMVIYSVGSYFGGHQDEELSPNMIATMVIVLPKSHIGGDLVINYFHKNHKLVSENINESNIKCISFYGDCMHKVTKILQGHRIVLIYDLVLKSGSPETKKVDGPLINAFKEYFSVKESPLQLLHFLNHQYTKKSLNWDMLKGEDRKIRTLLYSIAQELRLQIKLVFVEAHAVLCDKKIKDVDMELKLWIDENNRKVRFLNYFIKSDDVCCINKSVFDLFCNKNRIHVSNLYVPDDDYGCTAIILYPESRKHCMNFMLYYKYSLEQLHKLCSTAGHQNEVKVIIKDAGIYIHNQTSKNEKSDFQKLADVALYIEDSEIAFSLLSRFEWSVLSADIATALAKFKTQYSTQWCINLLEFMYKNCSCSPALEKIDVLTQTYMQSGGDPKIVHLLIKVQYEAIIRKTPSDNSQNVESNSALAKRLDLFQEILNACLIGMDHSKMTQIIQHAFANPELYPSSSLVNVFLKFTDTTKLEDILHHQELKNCLMKPIDHMVMSKMQQKRDWSITVLLSCRCRHCKIATDFLFSSKERKKVWSIGKLTRAHLERIFDKCGVPVKFSNLRRSFVMVKTEELHRNISEELKKLKFFQRRLRALNVSEIKKKA